MASPQILLRGLSQQARQSLLHWSNGKLYKVVSTQPAVLIDVPADGVSIGSASTSDVVLDPTRSEAECGWIALLHCRLGWSGASITIEALALSPIFYQPASSALQSSTSRGSQAILEPGWTRLVLAKGWEFEIGVLGPPGAQQTIAYGSQHAPLPQEIERARAKPSRTSALDRRRRRDDHSGGASVSPSPTALSKYQRRMDIILHEPATCEVRLVEAGDKRVVMKRCLDKEKANHFVQEVNILRKLSHENIISFMDFRKDPLPVIYTPFIGPDLGEFKDGNKMSTFTPEEQDRIEDDMASALAYLKRQRIVHRDIKPKNVLFSGKAVIIDFGMACEEEKCVPDASSGTPHFLPPEAALLTKRSFAGDMWAMGVLLLYVRKYISGDFKNWELQEDAKHFRFRRHWQWITYVEDRAKLLPKRSKIRRMLERDPAQRIQAEELAAKGTCIRA